jgi:hypothetical protein
LNSSDAQFGYIPEDLFLDTFTGDAGPLLGDPVFFVGLLSAVKEMGTRNIPMVRSGTLGAKYQDGIPVRRLDNTVDMVNGHLIDCRAYRGFSGSPCFIQFVPETRETIGGERHTRLLGVVSAHFDLVDKGLLEGDLATMVGGVKVPVHAGVGVVVPVERVHELLNGDELRKKREDEDLRLVSRRQNEDGATLDMVGEPNEFERFHHLTKGLFAVSKDEADEVHRGHDGIVRPSPPARAEVSTATRSTPPSMQ